MATSNTNQNKSVMIIYIPHTFGTNGTRKGVTEQQIFWHMRNLNVGRIDHIDCNEIKDKNGFNVRKWFVHFSTWTAPDDATKTLNDGGHIEITYDDYGHYWKLFKHTPSAERNAPKKAVKVRVVGKDGNHIKNPFAALAIEEEKEVMTPTSIDKNEFPALGTDKNDPINPDTQDVEPTKTPEWPARSAVATTDNVAAEDA